MSVTNLRYLRIKYKILLKEIQSKAHISNQYASRAELLECHITKSLDSKIQQAMETIIKERQQEVAALEHEYARYKERLFQVRAEELS